MNTYYVFQSTSSPELRGFTEEPKGDKLPAEGGPWTLVQQIGSGEEWTLDVRRAVVAAGILENGFYLGGPIRRPEDSHPVIESDRVEGTAVFDRENNKIGTIERLLIEKVSGRVTYVDVTFGGFLGIGANHHRIPWEKLTYDRKLGAITRTSRKRRFEVLRASMTMTKPGRIASVSSRRGSTGGSQATRQSDTPWVF